MRNEKLEIVVSAARTILIKIRERKYYKSNLASAASYLPETFRSTAVGPAGFNMQDMCAAALDQLHIMRHDQHGDRFVQLAQK